MGEPKRRVERRRSACSPPPDARRRGCGAVRSPSDASPPGRNSAREPAPCDNGILAAFRDCGQAALLDRVVLFEVGQDAVDRVLLALEAEGRGVRDAGPRHRARRRGRAPRRRAARRRPARPAARPAPPARPGRPAASRRCARSARPAAAQRRLLADQDGLDAVAASAALRGWPRASRSPRHGHSAASAGRRTASEPVSWSADQRPGPATSTNTARPRRSIRCRTRETPNSSIPAARRRRAATPLVCQPVAMRIHDRHRGAEGDASTSAWRSITGER